MRWRAGQAATRGPQKPGEGARTAARGILGSKVLDLPFLEDPEERLEAGTHVEAAAVTSMSKPRLTSGTRVEGAG